MLEKVIIRKLETPLEIAEVERLNANIWGSQAIPSHQLLATVKNGGLLLGAFFEEQLIGFNYCFVGHGDDQLYLHSHMIGVDKTFRQRGVGELLKHAQQEFAREHGYQIVRWLYDPLDARMANISFSTLTAISHSYENNYYGDLEDDFNSGLPSDRIVVEWWIERRLVEDIMEELVDEAKELVPWSLTGSNLPELDHKRVFQHNKTYEEDVYLLAFPQNIQEIKLENPALAEDWRYKLRLMLTTLFNNGYAIVRVKRLEEHVHFYVLVRRSLLAL